MLKAGGGAAAGGNVGTGGDATAAPVGGGDTRVVPPPNRLFQKPPVPDVIADAGVAPTVGVPRVGDPNAGAGGNVPTGGAVATPVGEPFGKFPNRFPAPPLPQPIANGSSATTEPADRSGREGGVDIRRMT